MHFPSLELGTLPVAITAALFSIDIAIRIVMLGVVPHNRRPSTALAWLLAIFFIPYIGLLVFLLLGSPKLPKRRRVKQQYINELIIANTQGMDRSGYLSQVPSWVASAARLNRRLGAMPLVAGNSVDLHSSYSGSLDAMTRAVDEAETFVHVEFYILSFDDATAQFFDALQRAVDRGVIVRVLFDHIGSARSPRYGDMKRKLNAIGALWHAMLPVRPWAARFQRPDLRNHRKLIVIDGVVGFTGSQNVIDRSYNKKKNVRTGLQWKDLMVMLKGPIVQEVNAVFVTDWYSETNELLTEDVEVLEPAQGPGLKQAQIVPSGPGFDGENNLRLFNMLLHNASERIIVTSPYFVPDESMLYAITTAAERGLEVQLFVGAISDQTIVFHGQRSYYEALLRAGVRVFLYKSPYILHSKLVSIDDDVAVIGSSNMDMRSFSLNMEISLMVPDPEFVSRVREIEAEYRHDSTELTLQDWLDRPVLMKYLDNVARLTAALQ
ncbi:cardiolipin synthase [Spelaeicoccus albus]|uniref:Cardiolipin synthase n=1 Tax=Spelaeicoccus albus TaxID=1280376 RepID=A0A7Z0D3D7_9MICO|nr:cardiolipin synthase [Spelaeicoccus albus]NYI68139.1 cardiolipin synthase [Spelaeicoccus albus]